MLSGIIAIRKLHMKALKDYGFTCADEMLYPENHRYLNDLLAYVAVGARSVENQQHRLTASGLDIPVGMKNPTRRRPSRHDEFHNRRSTPPHLHLPRLGGGKQRQSPLPTPFSAAALTPAAIMFPIITMKIFWSFSTFMPKTDLKNPSVIVDVNHANSGKKNSWSK